MKKVFGLLAVAVLISVAVFFQVKAQGKKPLASVNSGQDAPDFSLPDTNNKTQSLSDYRGKYVVLEWVNLGCPYVRKHYDTGNIQGMQKELAGKDVVWLSICSSAEGKQGHMSPADWNKKLVEEKAAPTAVLLDPDGKVGRLYGAQTTPHMFVVNPEGKIIYQGAIDDKPSWYRSDVKEANNYVRTALSEAMGGKPITTAQTKAYGCSVKYP